jgi:hypothetical protein
MMSGAKAQSKNKTKSKYQQPNSDLKNKPVPVKKFFGEISDQEGHYDIDGVSFERKCGVIVASDRGKAKSRAHA